MSHPIGFRPPHVVACDRGGDHQALLRRATIQPPPPAPARAYRVQSTEQRGPLVVITLVREVVS